MARLRCLMMSGRGIVPDGKEIDGVYEGNVFDGYDMIGSRGLTLTCTFGSRE